MEPITYSYDGSLTGFLCCVFESYKHKEIPQEFFTEEMITLFSVRKISSEREKACRVWKALKQYGEAAEWVRIGWLSDEQKKESLLYQFIRATFAYGESVCRRNADPSVAPVLRMVLTIKHEAHLFCGFLRFSDYKGILATQISPKARVLILLKDHFINRFAGEIFIIHDITHGEALFHEGAKNAICPIDTLTLAQIGEKEKSYQRLWKKYYDSIAIEGRFNPKCRMTHMPKRFWKHLTEFQEETIFCEQPKVEPGLPSNIYEIPKDVEHEV